MPPRRREPDETAMLMNAQQAAASRTGSPTRIDFVRSQSNADEIEFSTIRSQSNADEHTSLNEINIPVYVTDAHTLNAVDGTGKKKKTRSCCGVELNGRLLLALAAALGALLVVALINEERPRACSESGPSPCIRTHSPRGDPSRKGFGERRDENLVFFDDFTSAASLKLWRPDVSLFADGNGCFEMYTEDPSNVRTHNGTLRLTPGLFADLGELRTGPHGARYAAADVMTGNCTPVIRVEVARAGAVCNSRGPDSCCTLAR